jgi:hypothetical protein
MLASAPSISPSTPHCLLPTPLRLPPAARDFEIHRLALVEFLSTRRIAEKYTISQTRVRQIIARVADWLTQMLPIKSEADIEKEKRYAIHLAAAQLQNQIQHLQYHWDGTSDPKFLRQQTRSILALARLGVPSHHLDSLADNAVPDNVVPSRREGHEVEPTFHSSDADTTNPPSITPPLHPSLAPSPLWPVSDRATSPTEGLPLTVESQISNPKSEIPNSSPPPSEDCSPSPASQPVDLKTFFRNYVSTAESVHDFFYGSEGAKDTLHGFDVMEKRLLTLIGQTYPQQTDRLRELNESLCNLHQSRANFILELSPEVRVTLDSRTPAPAKTNEPTPSDTTTSSRASQCSPLAPQGTRSGTDVPFSTRLSNSASAGTLGGQLPGNFQRPSAVDLGVPHGAEGAVVGTASQAEAIAPVGDEQQQSGVDDEQRSLERTPPRAEQRRRHFRQRSRERAADAANPAADEVLGG